MGICSPTLKSILLDPTFLGPVAQPVSFSRFQDSEEILCRVRMNAFRRHSLKKRRLVVKLISCHLPETGPFCGALCMKSKAKRSKKTLSGPILPCIGDSPPKEKVTISSILLHFCVPI